MGNIWEINKSKLTSLLIFSRVANVADFYQKVFNSYVVEHFCRQNRKIACIRKSTARKRENKIREIT